jgi:ABC-type multidrug transport system fused ATPase/permease subunit
MVLGWRVLSPLQAVFVSLNQIEHIREALRQLNGLMKMQIEETGPNEAWRGIDGAIRFSWVSHRYSQESDPVLFGVSFDVGKGEVVAITGPNGSGKSTIVKLLAGLYRPQAGSISIDGVDVRQMEPVRLRQQIGIVSQPTHLFYGTVAQNLRLSCPTASDEELIEAAKEARAYDDIMALSERMETRLTEDVMSRLPAGFRQKLALARVYLRRAPIMVFDEATQGLDEDGDKAFLAAIQRMRGRSTILIVTHRPSHMRIADRLIVMKAGKVVTMGPPDKVLRGPAGGGSAPPDSQTA